MTKCFAESLVDFYQENQGKQTFPTAVVNLAMQMDKEAGRSDLTPLVVEGILAKRVGRTDLVGDAVKLMETVNYANAKVFDAVLDRMTRKQAA